MLRVDYTQLGQPPITLTLEEESDGQYIILDQHGGHYTLVPVDLDLAIKYMRRAEELKHAEIDEASVEWFRSLRAFGGEHSVRVDNVVPLRRRGIA